MSLIFHTNDPCPKCNKPMAQAEQHPTRNDLAVHNFYCSDCGLVKTQIISLKPDEPPPEEASQRSWRSRRRYKISSSFASILPASRTRAATAVSPLILTA